MRRPSSLLFSMIVIAVIDAPERYQDCRDGALCTGEDTTCPS